MLLVSQQYRITIHPIQSIRHLALSVLNLSIDIKCLNCPVSPVLRCYLHLRWHNFSSYIDIFPFNYPAALHLYPLQVACGTAVSYAVTEGGKLYR